MRSDYTPTVWAFAAELYAYDTQDEQCGYVREEKRDEYLERALFLTLCEPMAAHDAEVARAAKAEALEEAASSPVPRGAMTNFTRHWLRARAAKYRKGENNE